MTLQINDQLSIIIKLKKLLSFSSYVIKWHCNDKFNLYHCSWGQEKYSWQL